mgnify:CR=1 FL=1
MFLSRSLLQLIIFCVFVFGIIYGISFWSVFLKVKFMTRSFEKGITNEQVKDYTKLVRKMKIINYPDLWNTLRAGFTLINNAENIDPDLKEELMNLMLSRGVSLGNVKIHKGKKYI